MGRRRSTRERFRRWVAQQSSATAAADLIGCDRSYIHHLLDIDMGRRPGLAVAFGIERATASAKDQIRAVDWLS